MEKITSNLRLPAILSTILVLPFLILELVNRRAYPEGFPFPLFIILWLLPLAFIFILAGLLRNMHVPRSERIAPIAALLQVAILILLTWLWFSILFDQMPCFLGVPNCD